MNQSILARVILALCLIPAGRVTALAQPRTENVVLVTLDGARHQEIFGGLDLEVLRSFAGTTPAESHPLYRTYWAPTPEARRLKLMPFFWGTLMSEGSIAGNQQLGSVARVTNSHHFSYPGYAEILTGEAHDEEGSDFREARLRPSLPGRSSRGSLNTCPAQSRSTLVSKHCQAMIP